MLRGMGAPLGLQLVNERDEVTASAWVFVGLNVLVLQLVETSPAGRPSPCSCAALSAPQQQPRKLVVALGASSKPAQEYKGFASLKVLLYAANTLLVAPLARSAALLAGGGGE